MTGGDQLDPQEVNRVFALLEQGTSGTFWKYVDENVDWTVKGTHPLAGHYTSLKDFRHNTFDRIHRAVQGGNVRVNVKNIVIAGNWVTAELLSDAIALKGWRFANAYCWVTRWQNGKIVEVHAYVDSALTTRLIDEAER
ncbi:hypothetical protein WJX74_010793 [Apatococcus lobatus]|uniref:SnoaL-like domain-containing protein n=2 Tax=Apatococcus TaxID=904362 RepID=A0AAW1RS46_9CHLO